MRGESLGDLVVDPDFIELDDKKKGQRNKPEDYKQSKPSRKDSRRPREEYGRDDESPDLSSFRGHSSRDVLQEDEHEDPYTNGVEVPSNLQEVLLPKKNNNGATNKRQPLETEPRISINEDTKEPALTLQTNKEQPEQQVKVESTKPQDVKERIAELENIVLDIEKLNNSEFKKEITPSILKQLNELEEQVFEERGGFSPESQSLRHRVAMINRKDVLLRDKPDTLRVDTKRRGERPSLPQISTGGNGQKTEQLHNATGTTVEQPGVEKTTQPEKENAKVESGGEEYVAKREQMLERQKEAIKEGDFRRSDEIREEIENKDANLASRSSEELLDLLQKDFQNQDGEYSKTIAEVLPLIPGARFQTTLDGVPVSVTIGQQLGSQENPKHSITIVKEVPQKSESGQHVNLEPEEFIVLDEELVKHITPKGVTLKELLRTSEKQEMSEKGTVSQTETQENFSKQAEGRKYLNKTEIKNEADYKFDRIQSLLKELEPKGPWGDWARKCYDKYKNLGFKKRAAISFGLLGAGIVTGGVLGGGMLAARRWLSGAATAFGMYDTVTLLRDKNFSKRLEGAIQQLQTSKTDGTLGQRDRDPRIQIEQLDQLLSEAIVRGLYNGKNQTTLEQDASIARLLELRTKIEGTELRAEDHLATWLNETDSKLEKAFALEGRKRSVTKLGAGLAGFAVGSGAFAKGIGWVSERTGVSSTIREATAESKRFLGLTGEHVSSQPSSLTKGPEVASQATPDNVLEVDEKGVIGTLKEFKGKDPESYNRMMGQLREMYQSGTAGANNSDDAILTRFAHDYEQFNPGDLDKISHASIKITPEGFPTLEKVEYLDQPSGGQNTLDAATESRPSAGLETSHIETPVVEAAEPPKPPKSIDSAVASEKPPSTLDSAITGEAKPEAAPTIEKIVEISKPSSAVEIMNQRWGNEFTTKYLEQVGISRDGIEKFGSKSIADFLDVHEEALTPSEKLEYQKLDQWLNRESKIRGWNLTEYRTKSVDQALIDSVESPKAQIPIEYAQGSTRSEALKSYNDRIEAMKAEDAGVGKATQQKSTILAKHSEQAERIAKGENDAEKFKPKASEKIGKKPPTTKKPGILARIGGFVASVFLGGKRF